MNSNIVLHFRDKWNNEGNTFALGRAFIEGELYEEEQLAEYFNKSNTEDAVKLANGFWGLVKIYDNSILIVADRTRSYPLFYGVINNMAYISDDAYWIKEKVGDREFDEISKNELLLTGYVTGCDTLYKNVKQIQAGETVSIDLDEKNSFTVSPSKNYNFIHGNYFEGLSREQLLKEHELILFKSVNRLIKYANGRAIVVPLSGGYDSRLVATVLKKLNYSNVITFTYGRINNAECLISMEVAKKLDYKWIFIPYDNEKSYAWYNSKERRDFSTYGDNLSTILPDREWPAVWELKKQKLIPNDSVFAPGHSGDFISGGHIPEHLCKENVSKDQFIEEILKKHYVMWRWNGVKNDWISGFSNKILKCAEIELFDKKNYSSNAYEKWNWQENQVKRMENSVKIYDFFGYKYWVPLWDYEYMDFWCKVPLKYRINKNLYDEYVVNMYSQIANITIKEAKKREPPLDNKNILKKIWNKCFNKLSYLLAKETNMISKEELWDMDWEQASGRFKKEVYNKLLPYAVGRSSCTTLERLGYINSISKDVPEATLDLLKSLRNEKKVIIVQVGPYPEPMGGVSVYIKRMKQCLDLRGIPNEVWDLSKINKKIRDVINIRFRYIPFKYLFKKDIKLIHYNIHGISYKIYIGIFNELFFKRRKKILTIHGESKDIFTSRNNMLVKSLNSFDTIICVKSGDKEYLRKKGVKRPIYEIPAFIFPIENDECTKIPSYILDFINSKDFVISANAACIRFYDNQDLYGIDMCIDLIEKMKKNSQDVGLVFCIPDINNTKYFNILKNKIRDKEIESNFLFVNENMELYPIIKRTKLFLRPTNNDGYGVSIAEAIYYKVPAIASDVCERPEGTILFKSRDLDDLYRKTVDVIENYENAKEKLKGINFEDNALKLLEIYKEYLN